MSSRHLPAGQSIQPGQGGHYGLGQQQGYNGGMSPAEMGGNMVVGGSGHHHGHGPGPRRRGPPSHNMPQQYAPQYHQPMNMYANYMPYGAPHQYYNMPPQYQNGAQYQNGGMPSPGYVSGYQHFPRSPPAMHQQQYVPMTGVSVPPNYPRPSQQQSPALSSAYQPPPAPAPLPPHTPSSTQSSQMPPPSRTPETPQFRELVPREFVPSEVAPAPQPPREITPPPGIREPSFRAPLPWYSHPDEAWTARKPKLRRRNLLSADSEAVSLPIEQHEGALEQNELNVQAGLNLKTASQPGHVAESETSSTQPAQDITPATSSTSAAEVSRSRADTASSAAPSKNGETARHAAPVIPALPKHAARPSNAANPSTDNKEDAKTETGAEAPTAIDPEAEAAKPVARPPPSSWANLFASRAAASASQNAGSSGASVDGEGDANGGNSTSTEHLFPKSGGNSKGDAVRNYKVHSGEGMSFLEPRGLINTGNMCYMNSVLQVLMFCVPFYDFLQQVSKQAHHSFKSETPLIDAMIMFMHEFKMVKSAVSVDQLRSSLKAEDLERYGEPFTPEFVYEAIRQLPRFASMRRGHQQDAEEFLGFLLQSLDDECTSVMGVSLSGVSQADGAGNDVGASGDWHEVGKKQRAAVSRTSGHNISTPINKIFGGLLRSEFRVPGLKDSITTEPYQPLQLDIGAPDVNNVIDALRGLTRPERIQGDFNSARGRDVGGTKQVFIETLPPVLILHLKRFQFDNEGRGTVKIWKKVDYPLDLEIPREALSRQKRQTLGEKSLPRYKLISVVYHHGKNASGGHYTVDVRRQDGHDWLRFDDTVLRRVRSDDVAEKGAEDENRDLRNNNHTAAPVANRFEAMNGGEEGDEDGWKQVSTTAGGNKRWSNVVNGAGNEVPRSKQVKDSVKDNKVAYLLFYQRV